jgi:predicted small lipoprotein YifL
MKFLTILFFLGVCGCGIKGPPLPPIDEETIQKQKGDEVFSKLQPATEALPRSVDSSRGLKPKSKKKNK